MNKMLWFIQTNALMILTVIFQVNGLPGNLGFSEICNSTGLSRSPSAKFISHKSDGSQYACICSGPSCDTMTCTKLKTQPDVNDTIAGVPVIGGTEGTMVLEQPVITIVEEENNSVPPLEVIPVVQPKVRLRPFPPVRSRPRPFYPFGRRVPRTCLTPNGRRIEVNKEFINLMPHRKVCKCTQIGTSKPKIKCKTEICPLPPSPEDMAANGQECYDPWTRQKYELWSSYERNRSMTSDGSIKGLYRCRCLKWKIHCTVIDSPCCDFTTQRFVPAGSTFVPFKFRGYNCTCLGGKQKFGNCVPLTSTSGDNSPILAPIAKTPQILSLATHCIQSDGTRHPLNEEYEEVRDDGVTRICICKLHGRGTRTTCRIRGYLARP